MARLHINGKTRDVPVEGDTPLLWVIREHVGLTGTKYGCGIAQCGACSVHVNGEVRRSCSIPVKTTPKSFFMRLPDLVIACCAQRALLFRETVSSVNL